MMTDRRGDEFAAFAEGRGGEEDAEGCCPSRRPLSKIDDLGDHSIQTRRERLI
jgi:hypothetical protein